MTIQYYNTVFPNRDIDQMLPQHPDELVLIVGADGRIRSANNAALCAYGYLDFEIVGLHISEILEDPTAPTISWQMSAATVQGIAFDTIHKRRDGSIFPVNIRVHSLTIDNEPVLLGIIRVLESIS